MGGEARRGAASTMTGLEKTRSVRGDARLVGREPRLAGGLATGEGGQPLPRSREERLPTHVVLSLCRLCLLEVGLARLALLHEAVVLLGVTVEVRLGLVERGDGLVVLLLGAREALGVLGLLARELVDLLARLCLGLRAGQPREGESAQGISLRTASSTVLAFAALASSLPCFCVAFSADLTCFSSAFSSFLSVFSSFLCSFSACLTTLGSAAGAAALAGA